MVLLIGVFLFLVAAASVGLVSISLHFPLSDRIGSAAIMPVAWATFLGWLLFARRILKEGPSGFQIDSTAAGTASIGEVKR
jgi:hypothetical protein